MLSYSILDNEDEVDNYDAFLTSDIILLRYYYIITIFLLKIQKRKKKTIIFKVI